MPPKKKRRSQPPCQPGIAVSVLESEFASISPDKAVLNGHVVYQYVKSDRDIKATCNDLSLKGVLPDNLDILKFKFVLRQVIFKAFNKFKKLSNPRELQRFKVFLSEPCRFPLKTISESPVTSVECIDDTNVMLNVTAAVTMPPCSVANLPACSSVSLPLPSPVKTRKFVKTNCGECKILRKKLRTAISEKSSERQKYLTMQKHLRWQLIPVKRVTEKLKRTQNTVSRLKNELKSDSYKHKYELAMRRIRRLNRVLSEERAKFLSAKKLWQRDHDTVVRDLEQEVVELEDASKEIQQEENTLKKDGKVHSYKMRLMVFDCLMANSPTEKIPGLVKSIAGRLGFRVEPGAVPVRSTVESMAYELGVISDLQVAETLMDSPNVTLGFDSTTQEGVHVNAIHITTNTRCLTLSLEQLAGGTALDYSNHVFRCIQHLANVYSEFHSTNCDVVKKVMQNNISNIISDRAAVNHAAVRLISKEFDCKINELKCHLHPLEAITTSCKSVLRQLEIEISFDLKVLYGSGCAAEKVILAFNKLRFTDGKGDPAGFRSFLRKEKGLKEGLLTRYRGNRLHIIFYLAAVYYDHLDLFKQYVQSNCLHSSTLTSGLAEALKMPFVITELQALAIFGKLLTGPWMAIFYGSKDISHMEGFMIVKKVIQNIEGTINCDSIDGSSDFFGRKIDSSSFPCLMNISNNPILKKMIMQMLTKTVSVLYKQYKMYFSYTNEEINSMSLVSTSARLNNMDCEEIMGMFSAGQSRAPSATVMMLAAKIRAKKNKTIDYVNQHNNQETIILKSISFARSLKKKDIVNCNYLKDEIADRIKVKLRRKEIGLTKTIENKMKELIYSECGHLEDKFIDYDVDIHVLHNILNGKVVGERIIHNWLIDNIVCLYHGKIESVQIVKTRKSKIMKYVICYWKDSESYEENGEDFTVPMHEIAADFVFKDFFIV